MLIQFVVKNFLSFRDKQILSMRAPEASSIGAAFQEGKQQTVRAGGEEILRCAALYGANASGKSNLVRALGFVRSLILQGTASDKPIARRPFKLDPARGAQPSRFELVFVHDDVLYAYGFAVDSERVHSEWLYRGPEDSDELLFRRELDAASGQYVFEVGDALASNAGRKQFYDFLHQGTRTQQLFLHEAQERNAPELDPPLTWFRERLEIIFPDANHVALHRAVDSDPAFGAFLTDLLARADTRIREVSATRLSSSRAPGNIRASMARLLGDQDSMDDLDGRFSLFNSDARHQPAGCESLAAVLHLVRGEGSRGQLASLLTGRVRRDSARGLARSHRGGLPRRPLRCGSVPRQSPAPDLCREPGGLTVKIERTRLTRRGGGQRDARLFVIAAEGCVTEKQYFEGLRQARRDHRSTARPDRGDRRRGRYIVSAAARAVPARRVREALQSEPRARSALAGRGPGPLARAESSPQPRPGDPACTTKGYRAAVSNPCFELWLLGVPGHRSLPLRALGVPPGIVPSSGTRSAPRASLSTSSSHSIGSRASFPTSCRHSIGSRGQAASTFGTQQERRGTGA